jgi:hypothetical protein
MTAIKLTTGILATAMMVGGIVATSVGQNPDAIDNARSIAKSLQQKQANDSNAALDAAGVPASAKPAPGAPAPAVKPATIPGAKSALATPEPAAAAPKTVSASASHNQLRKVNVAQGADGIQIEINTSEAVTPRVSKLKSPARVVVELPETVVAGAQSKIPVGSDGVKGVRIGMDGKTPPTTSVVVDLEKALSYDLSGSGEKIILTLHGQDGAESGEQTAAKSETKAVAKTVAKSATAPAKTAAPTKGKTIVAEKIAAPAAKPAAKSAPKSAEKQQVAKETTPALPEVAPAAADASKIGDNSKQPKPEDKKWAMNGRRDPFFSPVVQQNGSGCSTGKKCLEIGNINLRGVVKSDNGFIAVVTNNLNKAYFLRENDPVFNGYVVRITGDSVVFQETVQDKLGKPLTREVVKRIFTPAV